MRSTWAEFYDKWGDLMGAWSNVFNEWALKSYARSAKLYAEEVFSLGEVIQNLLPDQNLLSEIEFTDEVESDGYPWAPYPGLQQVDDGALRESVVVDPAKDGEPIQIFVFGPPAIGTFHNGAFIEDEDETPHGDVAP